MNYLLNERFPIPEDALQELRSTELHTVGPELYAWKLALEMVIQLCKDGNTSFQILVTWRLIPLFKSIRNTEE